MKKSIKGEIPKITKAQFEYKTIRGFEFVGWENPPLTLPHMDIHLNEITIGDQTTLWCQLGEQLEKSTTTPSVYIVCENYRERKILDIAFAFPDKSY